MVTRAEFVKEAAGWLGTPYVKGGQVKGKAGGCDCGSFIYCVLKNSGCVGSDAMPWLPATWWVNAKGENYLHKLMNYTKLLGEHACSMSMAALPGSIILSRVGHSKHYNHAGIVMAWPKVLHAVQGGVVVCNATAHPLWASKTIAVLDLWNGAK